MMLITNSLHLAVFNSTYDMKKLILLTGIALSSFAVNAQIICVGISPAPVAKSYNFTWGAPPAWGSPDFNVPNTNITDTLIMVNDGTSGNNATYGNPLREEGCNASPANAYAGKIVVIRRNTCEFGAKAKRAQEAGAIGVIIVNRDIDVIAMGAGAEGSAVTIPVVMLNNTDGNALIAQMQQGPVVMFIGNKVGLNDDDLTIFTEGALRPRLATTHSLLSSDVVEANLDFGTWVHNFGSNDQTNVTINLTVKKGTSTVFTETSNPVNLVTGDSTFISFPDVNLSSYATGKYSYSYTLTSAATDEDLGDNEVKGEFDISDDVVSLVNLDNNGVIAPVSYSSPAAGTTAHEEWASCMTFKHAKASDVWMKGIYFAASLDSSELVGAEVNYSLSTWDDDMLVNETGQTFDQVTPVRAGSYYYEANDQKKVVYQPFDEEYQPINNQLYLLCLTVFDPDIRFGYGTQGYDQNITTDERWYYPVFRGTTDKFAGGFGNAPAIGIKAGVRSNAGVKENTISSSAYPNPAQSSLTVLVGQNGKAKLNVTDVAGRNVMASDVTVVGNRLETSVNELNAGTYVFQLNYENGVSSQFKVVVTN